MRSPLGEWEPAIDKAPGKELIEYLRTGGDSSLLSTFFDLRVGWSGGYPLIHDQLITYGAYQDLLTELDADLKHSLLPTALSIADSVPIDIFMQHYPCLLT